MGRLFLARAIARGAPHKGTPRPAVPRAESVREAVSLREEDGFTIIEALVAVIVLTVGLLAGYLLLNVAVHASAAVRARDGAVSLARQITEDARSIPYSQLSNATIVSQLQAMPGLASTSSSGSPWTIVRNGVTYTVTATETTYNDSKDPSGQPCSSASPCDFKQVTATVGWTTYQGLHHQVSETATMTRAGQDPGPAATGLQLLQSQWGTTGITGSGPNAPVVTSSSVTSLQFQVTAPTGTTAILWSLNGAGQASWNGSAPSGSSTTWVSAPWSIPVSGSSPVYDGTYTVGAQAEDATGVLGPGVTIQVRLIRSVPSAPAVTGYGFNQNLMVSGTPTTAAEFRWNPNPELNVVGYDVINPAGTVICQTSTSTTYPASCGTSAWCSTVNACVDLSPPSETASNLTYRISALYYDANNTLQQGTAQSVTLASGAPTAPATPTALAGTTQLDGSAILTWTPSSGGATASFYRIYRDGDNYTNRYDTIAASSCSTTCTYHDINRSTSHSYWVTAVGGTTPGSNMAESPPSNSWSG